MARAVDELMREICAALTGYDLATLMLLLAPEVVCHVRAWDARQRDTRGVAEAYRLWTDLSQRSGSRLEIRLEEVLAGGRYAAVVCAVEGEALPSALAVLVVRHDEGRVEECWLSAWRDPVGRPGVG